MHEIIELGGIMVREATCIIPNGDGLSAICSVDSSFIFEEGSQLVYRYDADGLIAEYNGIKVKIPIAMFSHVRGTLVEDESLGMVTNLHIYGKVNEYEAFFIGTLAIQSDEFIKAQGVAEYLLSNPR